MDIYTNPDKNSYLTGFRQRFLMPTDSGSIPAIALSKRSAGIVVSGYTMLIVFIFMVAWKLILSIIMAFWHTKCNPNRYIALIALWNSGEPMNAAFMMAEYCLKIFHTKLPLDTESASSPVGQSGEAGKNRRTRKGTGRDWRTLMWGILFLLLTLAISIGNIVAGVLIGGQLLMGNVAPVNPKSIFYPDVRLQTPKGDNGAGLAKVVAMKAPTALRTIGSIEASDEDVTIQGRVMMRNLDPPPDDSKGNHWAGVEYGYNVTGVDLGLQDDPKLRLEIKGSCHTDYSLLVRSSDDEDFYSLFGGKENTSVPHGAFAGFPPTASFHVDERTLKSGNTSYAVVVNSAGRLSFTSGEDPWYRTQLTDNGTGVAHRVSIGRPVLACWETATWNLNGKTSTLAGLKDLPGLKLQKIWAGDILLQEFAAPRVVSLGTAVGAAALKSASLSAAPNYILDAGRSRLTDDLKRLVLGSWVSSRNTFKDTSTYIVFKDTMQNIAKGPRGKVEASTARFVIQTGDVGTLSLRIIISVPSILGFLLLVQFLLKCVTQHGNPRRQNFWGNFIARGIALTATQLYRYLDEELYGQTRWKHRLAQIPATVSAVSTKSRTLKDHPDRKKYLPCSARKSTDLSRFPDDSSSQRSNGGESGSPATPTGSANTNSGSAANTNSVSAADEWKLFECAEPRPIRTGNLKDLNSDTKTGELTISRVEHPSVYWEGMSRADFKNVS